jgi:predicted nucleic acid-binding protein
MIVLDTNVPSEMMKAAPNQAVYDWYGTIQRNLLFLTSVTEAEILAGIAALPAGKRRAQLTELAIYTFENSFASRVFAFNSHAARHYADIVCSRRAIGKPIATLDAQIAAIARERGMAVATRNVRDFQYCGIDLIDPWAA